MVIEVADTTLDRGRGIKLRSYARAGIVCYWIVNLIDRQIEVYTQPDATAEVPTYRHRIVVSADQQVRLTLDQTEICHLADVDLLPSANSVPLDVEPNTFGGSKSF